MIDNKSAYWYTQLKSIKNPVSLDGVEEEYLFKFKAKEKNDKKGEVYFIKVHKYSYDVYFIKFHRQIDKLNKDKYKFRNSVQSSKKYFPRIIATCIKVCLDIKNKSNEDVIFAFYGQWDNNDIGNLNSQRFRIYRRALFSKVNELNYSFVSAYEINALFMIPNDKMDMELIKEIGEHFNKLFDLEELKIPTIQ